MKNNSFARFARAIFISANARARRAWRAEIIKYSNLRQYCRHPCHHRTCSSFLRVVPVKIKQEVVNLENIDSAHTFRLESVTSLGNHDVVPLRKYCFILEKNANY